LKLDAVLGALAVNEIVTENMASAARVHAMELGKTVEDYTLIAFGGAAPLHAARLAAKLGIKRVIIPPGASVGSALGFLTAPVAFHAVRSRYTRVNGMNITRANGLLDEMEQHAISLVRAGAPKAKLKLTRSAFMRYQGQGHEIEVQLPPGRLSTQSVQRLQAGFTRDYTALYGRAIPHLGVEIMSWSLTVATQMPPVKRAAAAARRKAPQATRRRRVFEATSAAWRNTPVYERQALAAGAGIKGPALIAEDQTTTVVTADFDACVNSLGCLVLDQRNKGPQ